MRSFFAVLLLAALAVASPTAHAQIIPSLSFGVAGGPVFASLNDVAGADLENSTGFHAGAFVDVSALALSVRTGAYYLRAGNVQQTVGGVVGETVSADFITIPVELHVQTPTPIVRGYALVGPEFRFPVGESGNLVSKRDVNVAANVGVGAKFTAPLVGVSGFADLRYAFDLTGFAEGQGLQTGNTYKLNAFLVRVGVGL
jgi:hypothetical protein